MPSAVSFRYARALVDVVTGKPPEPATGEAGNVTAQLKEFTQLLRDSAELKTLFVTPAISRAKKKVVLDEIAARLAWQPLTRNFLGVVLEHQRIPILEEIIEAFELLLNERLGVVVAQIRSARPLGETEKQDLEEALRRRTGKRVRMSFSLDPALLGGVTAQVGSTIYDGSVRGQLERLRAVLAGEAASRAS